MNMNIINSYSNRSQHNNVGTNTDDIFPTYTYNPNQNPNQNPIPSSSFDDFLEQLVEQKDAPCPLKRTSKNNKGYDKAIQQFEDEVKDMMTETHNTTRTRTNNTIVIVTYLAIARSASTTLQQKIKSSKKEIATMDTTSSHHNDDDDDDDGNSMIYIHQHHEHGCLLQDFEEFYRKRAEDTISHNNTHTHTHTRHIQLRVMVSLRHPLARITSGIARRKDHPDLLMKRSETNALFIHNFVLPVHVQDDNNENENDNDNGCRDSSQTCIDTVEERFVGALRNESHPLHEIARNVTIGPRLQNFMMPVSEYYLAQHSLMGGEPGLGLDTEVGFLCIDTLDDDYDATLVGWVGQKRWSDPAVSRATNNNNATRTKEIAAATESKVSSGNFKTVLSSFTKDSVDWVERTYVKDIALYQKHCPDGYRKYIETKMDVFS